VFVSSLTEQPIGATIAIMILTVASFILDGIPQLGWLHPYLLTHSWLQFGDLLRDPISWAGVQEGVLRAAAYAVVFGTAAWARFSSKDVTS
jgi:ABC-2 type transport system permease protein